MAATVKAPTKGGVSLFSKLHPETPCERPIDPDVRPLGFIRNVYPIDLRSLCLLVTKTGLSFHRRKFHVEVYFYLLRSGWDVLRTKTRQIGVTVGGMGTDTDPTLLSLTHLFRWRRERGKLSGGIFCTGTDDEILLLLLLGVGVGSPNWDVDSTSKTIPLFHFFLR